MSFGLALAWFSVGFFVASCCWWLGIKWQARRKRRVVKGYYGTINVPYSVIGKAMEDDINHQIREQLFGMGSRIGHYSDDIYYPFTKKTEPDDDEDY